MARRLVIRARENRPPYTSLPLDDGRTAVQSAGDLASGAAGRPLSPRARRARRRAARRENRGEGKETRIYGRDAGGVRVFARFVFIVRPFSPKDVVSRRGE